MQYRFAVIFGPLWIRSVLFTFYFITIIKVRWGLWGVVCSEGAGHPHARRGQERIAKCRWKLGILSNKYLSWSSSQLTLRVVFVIKFSFSIWSQILNFTSNLLIILKKNYKWVIWQFFREIWFLNHPDKEQHWLQVCIFFI